VARPALRLAPTFQDTGPPVSVAMATAPSRGLLLVSESAEHAAPGGGRALPLATIGLATRYIASVASFAARSGWTGEELVALVTEFERRTVQWVAASSVVRLVSPSCRLAIPRAGRAALLAGGRWRSAACSAADAERLIHGAAGRGAATLAARSGARQPRWVLEAGERWRRAGVRVGGHRATSVELGARWALEVVVVPRVPAAGLAALREQLASAPRCGWCHLPVLGTSCRRCLPEWV